MPGFPDLPIGYISLISRSSDPVRAVWAYRYKKAEISSITAAMSIDFCAFDPYAAVNLDKSDWNGYIIQYNRSSQPPFS
jgi:hypothetical protein